MVHFEHDHIEKSGLEGLQGVNRTVSPARSMTSLPFIVLQDSHLVTAEEFNRVQTPHFQFVKTTSISSSKVLSLLLENAS